MDASQADRITRRFERLYGERGRSTAAAVIRSLDAFVASQPNRAADPLTKLGDQRDVVLIAYAVLTSRKLRTS